MSTHTLPAFLPKKLAIILIAVFFVFTSCQKNQKAASDSPTSSILSIAFDLPDVHYRLGLVKYHDLLNEVLQTIGSGQQVLALSRVNQCTDLFEGAKRSAAMQESAKLLSEIVDKEKDGIDTLIMAEALYVLSRTFFYNKGFSFEPANGLIFQAMTLSNGLIHSPDSLIQQVALFQLARQHDVWEGLTKRYGQFVGKLTQAEWIYAASTALQIKEQYLGLDGPPIMRSLGNLAANHAELERNGNPVSQEDQTATMRKGIEFVEKMGATDISEYAELATHLLSAHLYHTISEGKRDTSAKYLSIWTRMLTGDSDYKLGDSITKVLDGEGINHFNYGLASNLANFIQQFGESRLEHTHQTLLVLIKENLKARYERGDLQEQRITKVTNINYKFIDQIIQYNINLPVRDIQAFELFNKGTPRYFIQEKELLINQQIAAQDTQFSHDLDRLHILQDSLILVEKALSKSPVSTDFWACYSLNQKLSYWREKVNSRRAGKIFDFSTPSLQEIQEYLAPNEVWVTMLSDNNEDYVTVCDVNDFVLDSIPMRSGELIHGVSPSVLKDQLMDKIANSSKWTSEDQEAFRQLATFCFEGRIPKNAEHVIISNGNIGYNNSAIWMLLLEEYMRSDSSFSLKSIRNENKLLNHIKDTDSLSPDLSHFIGLGPYFPKNEIILEEDYLASLMTRVGISDNSVYRYNFMPLMHNISEVLEIAGLVKGTAITGEDCSEASLLTNDFKNAVFHLSTHAIINSEEVDRSGIVLNGCDFGIGSGTDDNILHLHEIRKLDLDAALVVLSACETGIGPTRIRGIQWTLSNAFREAGCENIISSSWKVEDEATHDIMIGFYKQMILGKGKAEALFAAKEKYRRENPTKGPHFWAPLALYGDNLPVNLIPR